MKYVNMEALPRAERGKRAVWRLRRTGRMPAVVYGGRDADGKVDHSNTPVSVDMNRFNVVIHEGVKFVDLTVEGRTMNTIVKDLQWDALDDSILHVDFERIDLNDPVSVPVSLKFKGISKGEKLGGKLVKHLVEVIISGLPRELPESLEVRVDDMVAGDQFKVADLPLPDGITCVTEPEKTVAEVKLKLAVAEEEGEEGEAGAEGAEEGAEGAEKSDA